MEELDTKRKLKEGEYICNKCEGSGAIIESGKVTVSLCPKCYGTGIVDWVEQIVGKPEPEPENTMIGYAAGFNSVTVNANIALGYNSQTNGDFNINGNLNVSGDITTSGKIIAQNGSSIHLPENPIIGEIIHIVSNESPVISLVYNGSSWSLIK